MTGETFFDWLSQRTGRERLLLVFLVALGLPIAATFAVILPLAEARTDAKARAMEAEALHRWVSSQAELHAPSLLEGGPATDGDQTGQPIGISLLEQSLVAMDLRDRIAQLSNRQDGGLELAFERVPFDRLVAWLDSVAPNWGYRVAAFRIEATDTPGLVEASFVLDPAQ